MRARRAVPLTLILAVAPAVWGASPPPAQPEPPGKIPISTASAAAKQAYLRGRDLLEHLKALDAARAFTDAIRADRNFALAYYGLALSTPNPATRNEALRKAVGLANAGKASDNEQHMIKAIEAGANSRAGAALEHLRTLVRDLPNDERGHTLLGSLYLALQDYGSAIAEYRKAIAINPDLPPPYTQLALALRMEGKFDEAEQPAKKYIELIPDSPAPLCAYGELLMRAGRFADSITEYERALKFDRKLADAYVSIASDEMFSGKFQDARKTLGKFETAAASVDDRRQAHFWTAVSYLHQGETKAALDEVQAMYDLAKRDTNPIAMCGDLNLMGVILLESGQPDAAKAKFDESVTLINNSYVPGDTRDTVSRNHVADLARVKLAKGDIAGAEADAKTYRDSAAGFKVPIEIAKAHELDGAVALAKSDAKTAIAELKQANQLDPRVVFELGEAYSAAGDAAAAKEMFTHAANFNAPELGLAFVRAKAQAKLKE